MITQKELLENLLYDKDTGVFTRKISLNTKVKVGDVAHVAYLSAKTKVHMKERTE
jgi:hypothetical protein